MKRLFSKLKAMFILLRAGRFAEAWEEIRLWWYSDSVSYGLRRDLTQPFDAPPPSIPLYVRPLEETDIPAIFAGIHSSSDVDAYLLANRYEFHMQDIPTCYLVLTQDEKPVYFQWLIGPQYNATLQRYFKGMFPPLKDDEALLEYAFTMPEFRSQHLMPPAVSLIAEQVSDIDARWAIGFIREDNIPALKGAKRAGFRPYIERHERWRYFRRTVDFQPLHKPPYPFDHN